jgi:hypothetical protein
VSRLGVRNGNIFNLPKNKAEDKEGAEKLDEKAIPPAGASVIDSNR